MGFRPGASHQAALQQEQLQPPRTTRRCATPRGGPRWLCQPWGRGARPRRRRSECPSRRCAGRPRGYCAQRGEGEGCAGAQADSETAMPREGKSERKRRGERDTADLKWSRTSTERTVYTTPSASSRACAHTPLCEGDTCISRAPSPCQHEVTPTGHTAQRSRGTRSERPRRRARAHQQVVELGRAVRQLRGASGARGANLEHHARMHGLRLRPRRTRAALLRQRRRRPAAAAASRLALALAHGGRVARRVARVVVGARRGVHRRRQKERCWLRAPCFLSSLHR